MAVSLIPLGIAAMLLVMHASPRQSFTNYIGWLAYGFLLGAGLGFGMIDLRSEIGGDVWFSEQYFGYALAFTIGGALIGTFIGAAVCKMGRTSTWTNPALRWAWWLLPVFMLVYVLLLRPGFCARS